MSSYRSAYQRSLIIGGDIAAMEARAGMLVSEIVMLEAKAGAVRGFVETAPLVGDQRYAEAAGVAVGSAVARTAGAGRDDLADALRGVQGTAGSTGQIGALLDLAGAAIAWATVLSLADAETSAAMPTRSGGRSGRLQVASGANHRPARTDGEQALRDGLISAREVFLGRVRADYRRQLATRTVHQVIAADPRCGHITFAVGVDRYSRVGDLTSAERYDIAAFLTLAREREVAVV